MGDAMNTMTRLLTRTPNPKTGKMRSEIVIDDVREVIEFLHLLDHELAEREFAAGDAYSVADITGMIAIDFMKPARIKVPEECTNVLRWYAALTSRPSATA